MISSLHFSEVRQHHHGSHMQRRPERDQGRAQEFPQRPFFMQVTSSSSPETLKKEEALVACEMLWTEHRHHPIVSGSFGGLGFLSWYLAGKIRAFDRGGHVAKLCVVILPLLLAAMVAVSRVSDYWHHWQDVFAGSILGRFTHRLSTIDSPSICYQLFWIEDQPAVLLWLCRVGSCFVLLPAVFPTAIWWTRYDTDLWCMVALRILADKIFVLFCSFFTFLLFWEILFSLF
jgi:hypothetical protein